MFITNYIKDIYKGVKSLLTGMKVTGYYFTHPKEVITEQYPDNRDTLKLADRFRGEVVMIHDENNEHACTGCSACELACPNGTIKIINKFEINAEGKKKKAIDTFIYHLELCTMCNLCIVACPTDTIKMEPNFEHSVFDRSRIMNSSAIIFYLISAFVLGTGLLAVTTGKVFRSAIWLLFSLMGIAGLYFWMEVEFIAAVQIIVYVGGIVVLIIFSIFLTQKSGEEMPKPKIKKSLV
jgi:NADH-quinone oxidoreductase subunit I